MLELTLNNRAIPLPVDFSMQLTWKSPVTAFDKIPQGYGFGISIPINDYTRAIFGNPQRFTKQRLTNDQKFTGFEVRFGGALLMAGTLVITDATNGYNATLIDLVGVLSEKEQERDLLEIPKFSEELPWINTSQYAPETHNYCCFPIQNSDFFKDKGVTVKRTVTVPDPKRAGKTKDVEYETEVMTFCYNKSVKSTVNATEGIGAIKELPSEISLEKLEQKGNTYEVGEVSVISPFFYLNYVIKEALKSSGFHIDENYLTTDFSLKHLCIFNNYDITNTDFTQSGEILYAPYSPDFTDDLLWTDTDGNIVSTSMQSLAIKLYSYIRRYDDLKVIAKNNLPKISVGELLMGVQNLLNVCFHFLPNNVVNIYNRDEILKGTATDIDKYFLGNWQPGEKKSVTLKFSREHEKNDLIFGEDYKDLGDRRDDIKEAVTNYAQLIALTGVTEGEIRFVKEVNAFYEYKWITQSETDTTTFDSDFNDVFGWEKTSIGLQNGFYAYGREEVEEIKSIWSACWGMNINGIANTAIVRQQGNMASWKSKQQPFGPRLLIQAHETVGGNETGIFSFEYEKPNTGLLAKYWRRWNPFWANRLPVTGDFDFPVNVLRATIYNICNKHRTREGEFLIDEMKTVLYINRIGATTINGFKVD